MKDYQVLWLLWTIMLHLYYTSPEKPLGALITAGILLGASFIFMIHSKTEDNK